MLRRFLFLLALLASLTAAQANEHSGVLEQLPFISDEEFEQAAPLTGSAPLTLDGSPLPYDKETNTYYLPVSKEEALAERSLHLENAPGVSYSLWDPGDGSVRLCALSADGMRTASLVFTTLPVLELETASGMLPEDDVQRGTLTQLTGDGGQLKIEQSEVEINLRGNTSRRLPKKSYRVKIIENDGQKKDLSIAGLRSDDDWIFNPMYSDTSKIREPLGYWLWDQMNSVGQEAASSRSAYAEVLINGAYWGLYGVQERIDRKQVNADKYTGVLYKVFANDRPSVQTLLECMDTQLCHGFEVSHAGTAVADMRWTPAASYMAALEGEENPGQATLSLENTIDYGLFVMMTQAYDCHFKNQFLNCVYTDGSYTMYKIPWDLNHTFGDAWNGDSESTNYLDYLIDDELVFDGAFSILLEQNDAQTNSMIRDRWETLREETLTQERILEKAYALYLPLQDALVRDSARWPKSGMGDGNVPHLRDIELFIQRILPQIDDFVRSL